MGESGCGKTVTAQSILRLYPERWIAYPRGQVLFEGRDILPHGPGNAAAPARRPHQHGLPGAHVLAQPAAHRAAPALRDALPAPRAFPRLGARGLPGVAGAGGPERSGAEAVRLPPPALRRGAAAGDDRHGPGQPAAPADRRRADHGPGRDHPGPDPGADRPPEARAHHGRAVHHPRPGDRAPDRRPGGGHARRGAGGDRTRGAGVRPPPGALHAGLAGGGALLHVPGAGPRPAGAAGLGGPEGLVSHQARIFSRHPRAREGRGWGHAHGAPRPDPGGGGRERLRQDHPGQGGAAPGVQPRDDFIPGTRLAEAGRPEAAPAAPPHGR